MATGTFYLRPTADISLEHTPSSGDVGYLMINEEVCDTSSTYIELRSTSDATATSVFSLDGKLLPEIETITSANLVICDLGSSLSSEGTDHNMTYTLTIDGTDVYSSGVWYGDGSYKTTVTEVTDAVTMLNDYIRANGSNSLPSISITVYSKIKVSSNNKSSSSIYVRASQIYLEVTCEYVAGIDIYKKVNGAWAQAQSAYQKQDGAWVEITEEECKSILSSSLCSR